MGLSDYRGRYRVPEECSDPHEVLEHVARSRGCMRTGGKFDTARAAEIVVRDFRLGEAWPCYFGVAMSFAAEE